MAAVSRTSVPMKEQVCSKEEYHDDQFRERSKCAQKYRNVLFIIQSFAPSHEQCQLVRISYQNLHFTVHCFWDLFRRATYRYQSFRYVVVVDHYFSTVRNCSAVRATRLQREALRRGSTSTSSTTRSNKHQTSVAQTSFQPALKCDLKKENTVHWNWKSQVFTLLHLS